MARLDPNIYPDRLAFEQYAHQIRAKEIDNAFHAAGAWLQAWRHGHTSQFGRLAVAESPQPQRRVTH